MILWLQAVLFCALTLQCSDDKNGESYTFRLSISDWPITPGSLSQRVDIEAPDRWSAAVAYAEAESEPWLTVEPASGRAGRSSFTLKAKTNPSLGARNATVTVTCGGESRTIAVSQPAGEGVEVTPTEHELEYCDTVIRVTVSHNVSFRVDIVYLSGGQTKWITQVPSGKSDVEKSEVKFNVAANTNGTQTSTPERKAVIRITDVSGKATDVPVLQRGYDDGTRSLKVMTFNIQTTNTRPWDERREGVVKMLREENPDMFGLQEARIDVLNTFDERLGNYARVGIDRDGSPQSSEYMSVFYRKDRFVLVASGNFWLSETPDQMSIGWDAAYRRIATWVKLRERDSGKEILYLNTHFDHKSATARRNSAELIVARLKKYGADDLATFVTGDLNVAYTNAAMAPLTGYLTGARESFSPMDQTPTFHNNGSSAAFIDHILYRNIDAPQSYRVLTDCYGVQKDGKDYYLSDHYPVAAAFSYVKP